MHTILKYGRLGVRSRPVYQYVHVHTVVVTSTEAGDVMPYTCVPTTARGCPDRLGCLTLRRATLLAALVSVIFALLIFAHEVALEGGFNLRNYVVLAFCVVWLIVTSLLVLGTCKRAQFLLLPWMILTCILTPLFMVGIVAGGKVIASCVEEHTGESCSHEYHLFGTNDHTAASIKLGVLLVMFILNLKRDLPSSILDQRNARYDDQCVASEHGFPKCTLLRILRTVLEIRQSISFLLVYRYFIFLSSHENRKRKQDVSAADGETHDELHASTAGSTVRYERFQDDEDPETNVPLCPDKTDEDDDNRETTT